jgi:hypothetical protein
MVYIFVNKIIPPSLFLCNYREGVAGELGLGTIEMRGLMSRSVARFFGKST